MSDHKKHAQIATPDLGQFARTEWSIHGAPCSLIQKKVHRWIELLKPGMKTAFLDASHQEGNDPESDAPDFHYRTTPDGLDFFRRTPLKDYDLKINMQRPGMLLINGNHFSGARQIVILDERKRESLSRKTDRLTNLDLILTTESNLQAYDFLLPLMKDTTAVLSVDDDEKIVEWLKAEKLKTTPKIKGLVLAGGKSVRMGKDKGEIVYHEKDQRHHTAELLKPYCEEVFISCRPDQTDTIKSDFPLLPDSFLDLGPFGAILSAFREDPNSAWFVVACDLPLLDKMTLERLVAHRSTEHIATAYRTGEKQFPEPLITIWEPSAYPRSLEFLALGYSCPRKVLINSDSNLLDPPNMDALTNVNTEKEMKDAMKTIREK